MEIVVDTHAFIWYLSGDKKLSASAKRALDVAVKGENKLIISLVVLMEALVLIEKKRILFTIDELNKKIVSFPDAIVYPIGLDVFEAMQRVNKNLELHDRIIVATAHIHKALVISADKDIQSLGDVKIIW